MSGDSLSYGLSASAATKVSRSRRHVDRRRAASSPTRIERDVGRRVRRRRPIAVPIGDSDARPSRRPIESSPIATGMSGAGRAARGRVDVRDLGRALRLVRPDRCCSARRRREARSASRRRRGDARDAVPSAERRHESRRRTRRRRRRSTTPSRNRVAQLALSRVASRKAWSPAPGGAGRDGAPPFACR